MEDRSCWRVSVGGRRREEISWVACEGCLRQSKGEDDKVRGIAPGAVEIGIWSECLLNWIKHPRELWDLGRQILMESESWRKRVGRDFKRDMRGVSQLLKWKKGGGKVGLKRKMEEE